MKTLRLAIGISLAAATAAALTAAVLAQAQGGPVAARKRLLVIGDEKGYRHEAVTRAMVTVERLGRDSGLWETIIRTDPEPLTKRKLEYNAKNLNDFDAVLFYTGGTLAMDDQQKADLLSFVRDDGKGFIGIHSAAITFTKWPEYGEMLGGYYDEHPWNTFEAPIVVEDAKFPGMDQYVFYPKTIMFGTDPVAIDRVLLDIIDDERKKRGAISVWDRRLSTLQSMNTRRRDQDPNVNILIREPGHIAFAGKLGLGEADKAKIKLQEIVV